jgi:hypothetical protein
MCICITLRAWERVRRVYRAQGALCVTKSLRHLPTPFIPDQLQYSVAESAVTYSVQ